MKGTWGKDTLFQRHDHLMLTFTLILIGQVAWLRSGYCPFLGGNLATWQSKKQSDVARSSAEAEFRALTQRICECKWIRLLEELGFTQTMLMQYHGSNFHCPQFSPL